MGLKLARLTIIAGLLLTTSCGEAALSYEQFDECMDAGMPIAREDVENGADQDSVIRDLMDVCGIGDLSEEERAKIPDPS